MAIPKGRIQLMRSIMDLYRNNLRDNLDLDAIMIDKYMTALKTIHDKLRNEDKEAEEFAKFIADERAKQFQLSLFAVTPDKNLLADTSPQLP